MPNSLVLNGYCCAENGGPLLATGINHELADVEAALTKTEANGCRECFSNQSGGLLHAGPHEVLYIRSHRGSGEKIRPLDISYQEYIAGSLVILDRMLQDEAISTDALDFCAYLKFVAKKATSFRSSSVLAFDDEFRTELASGSSSLRSFGDMERLSDIAASHFDAAAALKPTVSGPPGPRSGQRQNPRSRASSGQVCFKWNNNAKDCNGCNFAHSCMVCDSTSHGLSFHRQGQAKEPSA